MGSWDRVKFLVLLGGVWLVLVWAAMADDPNLPFGDAVRTHVRSNAWILVLFGLEVLRQVHYLISEHSVGYHRRWTSLFAAFERRTGKMNDWTRYRMGRAFKYLLVLLLASVILGKAYDVSPVQGLFRLPTAIWGAMPMIVQVMFFMFLAVIQFVAIFWFLSRGGVETYFPEDIETRFSDVWGQDPVVERVKENMLFLENPESIEEKGGYVPGGILLWGPPGTGKTLMAEAVAGETGKPYVFVDPGAFTNMFMGVGILKVKSLFRKLRKLAVRYGGVIAFFDEADSLGNRGAGVSTGGMFSPSSEPRAWERLTSCNGLSYTSPATASMVLRAGLSGTATPDERPGLVSRFVMGAGMGGGGMGTLQALLSELSGLKKPRGFVNRVVRRGLGLRPKPPPKYRLMIMMATNMPQALDEALLRPGRIDRIYKVGYPSKEGRKRTYEGYFAKVSHSLVDADIEKLAVMTPYATGAKIKDMVNESLIVAIRNGRDTITWADVMSAKQLKDLGPPEDVEYIQRERHAVAVHEACHAVAAVKVRRHLTIDIATIEKGGTYLGMVASIPPEDQFTRWRSEYEADIIVSLASLAGERIFFGGDNSSGVSGDLDSATRVATMMEGYWGMGSTVASHGVTHEVGIGGGGRPGGEGKNGKDREKELLESGLGQRIEEKLAELLERTVLLLQENRQLVLAVAHALESNKTLAGEDVVAVVEGRQGPLIDGRPYHTPEFLELAEQYHNAAVAAHEGHGDVHLPLPRWSTNGTSGTNGRHPVSFEPPPAAGTIEADAEDVPVRVPEAEAGEIGDRDGDGGEPVVDYVEEPPAPPDGRRRLRRPRD